MTRSINDTRTSTARHLAVAAVLGWFAAACLAGVAGAVDQHGRPPLVLLT